MHLKRHSYPYPMDAYNDILRANPGEMEVSCRVDGHLPEDLLGGVYYLNGPGLMELGGRLMHPFDGHGFLRALWMDEPNSVRFRSRFVKTDAYQAESKVGKLCFRGFGTMVSDSWWENWKAPPHKNVSNTCVTPWGGKLLSLWEGGRPYVVDPLTLETQGVATFGEVFPKEVPVMAHTRFDAKQQRLVFLSVEPGRFTKFHFFELDAQNQLVSMRSTALDELTFVHDFLITENYYVLVMNPVLPNLMEFVKYKLAMSPMIRMLKTDSRPSRIVLIPRAEGGEVQTISTEKTLFAFHHVDAYEEMNEAGQVERVHLRTCAFQSPFHLGHEFGYQGPYEDFDTAVLDDSERQELVHIELDLKSQRATSRTISPWSIDFPRVHPERDGLRCQFVYAATCNRKEGASVPFNTVAQIELQREIAEVWSPGEEWLVGEPVFAPKPGAKTESDGWVLVMIYNGSQRQTQLCVLHAGEFARGPVARIHMPALLPMGFHGHWSQNPLNTEDTKTKADA